MTSLLPINLIPRRLGFRAAEVQARKDPAGEARFIVQETEICGRPLEVLGACHTRNAAEAFCANTFTVVQGRRIYRYETIRRMPCEKST